MLLKKTVNIAKARIIGAGTGPAGLAMAGPYSAEVYAFDFYVVSFLD